MERENYISDIKDYWQYIQDGGFMPTPPKHSYGKGNWGSGRRYDYHQRYNDCRYSSRSYYRDWQYGFHSQPYNHFNQDFYSSQNRYSRPRGRPHFLRHQVYRFSQPPFRRQFTSGGKVTKRNQLPTSHQHFSSDPTSVNCYGDQPTPRNQSPPKPQVFSTDQTSDDKPPSKSQSPPKTQPPSHHQGSSKNQPPALDQNFSKDQPDTIPKEELPPSQPSPTEQTPKGYPSSRNLRPRKIQPTPKPKRGKQRKQ